MRPRFAACCVRGRLETFAALVCGRAFAFATAVRGCAFFAAVVRGRAFVFAAVVRGRAFALPTLVRRRLLLDDFLPRFFGRTTAMLRPPDGVQLPLTRRRPVMPHPRRARAE